MHSNKSIILASSSTYRRRQLEQLGFTFECINPEIDEAPLLDENPALQARRLATAKASKVLVSRPDALIIGSDQTAALGQDTLGKPLTQANAFAQLKACSNQLVTFYTGICVASASKILATVIPTRVQFLPLSDAAIWEYIRKDMPLDCAGSFKCEGLGIALFASITSDDPSALIGLPLIAVNLMLKQHDYEVLRSD